MRIQKIFLAIPFLFLFAGCGEVQFPESVSTPTPSSTPTPQALNASPTASPATTLTGGSCEAITKERDNLAEAIKISQEELRSCKTENATLATQTATVSETSDQIKQFAPIIEKYLSETEQKEFPFTLCGTLGKAAGQDWYADFEAALSTSGIQFSPLKRALKADDLGGVCASDEGKIAIFLGALSSDKSQFHLIKYNMETKAVDPAIVLSGSCGNTCPTKFGKRYGSMITLNGKGKEYKYYYDANVIVE